LGPVWAATPPPPPLVMPPRNQPRGNMQQDVGPPKPNRKNQKTRAIPPGNRAGPHPNTPPPPINS